MIKIFLIVHRPIRVFSLFFVVVVVQKALNVQTHTKLSEAIASIDIESRFGIQQSYTTKKKW